MDVRQEVPGKVRRSLEENVACLKNREEANKVE